VKKKRFSVEPFVAALKQLELGLPISQAARQLGASEQAIYLWKKQYAGLESGQPNPRSELSTNETNVSTRANSRFF